MSQAEKTLDRLATKAGVLCSLPSVAMEVLRLTDDPSVNAGALKACIEKDPALCGRLLQVVNSSVFGLPRKVADLNQAVALLGIKPLKLLVLGFSLPEGLFAGAGAEVLQWYWRRTLTKAVVARELAKHAKRLSGDEAFLAGLLQDIGLLVLIGQLGDAYLRLVEKVRGRKAVLQPTEREVFGFDHTQVSARLLRQWGLPAFLIEAVQTPLTELAPTGFGRILQLAELVAQILVDARTEMLGPLIKQAAEELDIKREAVESLLCELNDRVGQLAEVMAVDLAEGVDTRELLGQAHQRMAQLALEMATTTSLAQVDPVVLEETQLTDQLRAMAANLASEPDEPVEPAEPVKPSTREVDETKAPKAPDTPVASREDRPAIESAPRKPPETFSATLAACRNGHQALSVVLVEWVDWAGLRKRFHQEGADQLRQVLRAVCSNLDHHDLACHPYGDCGCAVILGDCDRQLAIEMGHILIDRLRRVAKHSVRLAAGVASVSIPTRSLHADDLWDAAERCLYGSHASGGNVVKSIEIY